MVDDGRARIGDVPNIAKLRKQWDGEGRRVRAHAKTVEREPPVNGSTDGAALLDQVHKFLGRFISYPSKEAHDAHTLWIAHTHAMDAWESTPRLALLSPEPGSGKTRVLEVSEPLVPRPVEAVNVSPAYLFRKVAADEGRPTILFDEIDTVFGPKAKDNEEIRGLLNAGHRKGAVAGRCVVIGKQVKTEGDPCVLRSGTGGPRRSARHHPHALSFSECGGARLMSGWKHGADVSTQGKARRSEISSPCGRKPSWATSSTHGRRCRMA